MKKVIKKSLKKSKLKINFNIIYLRSRHGAVRIKTRDDLKKISDCAISLLGSIRKMEDSSGFDMETEETDDGEGESEELPPFIKGYG